MKRIRQVALVARDLEPALDDACAMLDIEVAYRDPAVSVFGLKNAVMPIGDAFLEIVSPFRDDCSAARYLERRRGDGGYMVIFQTDDLPAARKRVQAANARIVFEHEESDIATLHIHPRDTGGTLLSIDAAVPEDSWRWAGPDWRRARRSSRVSAIAGVEIECESPAEVASRWSEILGAEAQATGAGGHEIRAGEHAVRFVPSRDSRGDGLHTVILRAGAHSAIEKAARDRGRLLGPGSIKIAGTCFRLA